MCVSPLGNVFGAFYAHRTAGGYGAIGRELAPLTHCVAQGQRLVLADAKKQKDAALEMGQPPKQVVQFYLNMCNYIVLVYMHYLFKG